VEDCIGGWVLIHVGFAMSRIDEAQAQETLRILTELGEAQQKMAAMREPGRGRLERVSGEELNIESTEVEMV
jgi:hydrogenase expression/formation protein HypC